MTLPKPKSSRQNGGNITSDLAKLAIPLGLILSRTGLEKLIARTKTADRTKTPASPVRRRASLSGGKASPVKKADGKGKSKSKGTHKGKSDSEARNEYIRKQFQAIAKRVQEIFAKARSQKAKAKAKA